MKLSVIIPVYQVEATLNRCVESVLSQHVDDMEVILVDDGSKDNSPQICDEWAKKGRRIRVIHKENGGVSDARNAGLAIAQGDFITFVDADDYLEAETYSALLDIMLANNNYDLLEFPYEQEGIMYQWEEQTYQNADSYWLQGHGYEHAFVWNKVFRRTLFQDLRFPLDRTLGEDMYLLKDLVSRAKTITITKLGLYHYTQNPRYSTKYWSAQQTQQMLEALMQIMNTLPPQDSVERQELYLDMINRQIDTYNAGGPILLQPYEYALKIRNGLSLKHKIKIILYQIFGIKQLCRIFNIINKKLLRH